MPDRAGQRYSVEVAGVTLKTLNDEGLTCLRRVVGMANEERKLRLRENEKARRQQDERNRSVDEQAAELRAQRQSES